MTWTITPKALQLLLDFEVGGGQTYYERHLRHPTWPGGDSGVTIGIGYDLGYCTRVEFQSDWHGLDMASRSGLLLVLGIKGSDARESLPAVREFVIPWQLALSVFMETVLPRWFQRARAIYPGLESLPGDAQGALVSLVYNRGSSLTGPRRAEMREIRDLVLSGDLVGIARQIRQMKRLWAGTSIESGMARRRDAEADLVEHAAD
ncbi:MAG: hypothetical protein K1X53_14320 [Candidatus Sumerlaeaceae bacterium]|nr:hypothetical protein [Candidatus Sumerlaeaceae bacterium]